jgi:hypothetical protein
MNLQTYPGELIYMPDMLVAIVSLKQYADLTGGTYRSTVTHWMSRAQRKWIDGKTGVLVSFLEEGGEQVEGLPVKGSYSALNCYYLTLIDKDFARKQYEKVKTLFWKGGAVQDSKSTMTVLASSAWTSMQAHSIRTEPIGHRLLCWPCLLL